MTDIYDIKNLFLGNIINYLYSFIFLIFVIFIYFLDKKFGEKIEKITEVKQEKQEKKSKNFLKILDNFEKKYINEKKEIFYKKLTKILKEIILQYFGKDISKMTFKEIDNLKIQENLKQIIKFSYFREYKKIFDDNPEIRKKIILETKKILKGI